MVDLEKGLLRRPTKEDIEYLSNNIRAVDREEILAICGKSIREVFEATKGIYEHSHVWDIDGKLIAIFGVEPYPDSEYKGIGAIWFLATDDFDEYKLAFRNDSREVCKRMQDGYYYVSNYVHVRNKVAIKWLKWLGFKMYDPEPIGINGEMFCKFEAGDHV